MTIAKVNNHQPGLNICRGLLCSVLLNISRHLVLGEIYNHKKLEAEYGIVPKGGSDCELLPELFSKVKLYDL